LRKDLREPGEQVQLLVYGLLLDPAPEAAGYLSLQRPKDPRSPEDGVATLVPYPETLAAAAADFEAALVAALGRVAHGERLPASGPESICRRCELRSLCRYGFTAPPADGAAA
jgi:ATP-dependent helicase/nuclease subunit B